MDKKTKIMIGIIAGLVLVACIVFGFVINELNGENSNNSSNSSTGQKISDDEISDIEKSTISTISYSADEESGVYNNYTAKINLNSMSVEGSGTQISGTEIKITSGGTYYFSGTSSDANIVVDADKNSDVVLVFDNVSLTSTKTAVINGITASKIIVNAVEGTTNTFTDSSSYTVFTEDDEPDSTIFSKTDLVINGSGKIIINANYKDGIASKDTLKIINTNVKVTSNDDGIRGKDSIAIKNSNIEINSKGDAIKSTNTDENTGYIVIEGGTININSALDGVQAETTLSITNANITINNTGNPNNKDSEGNEISSKGIKAGKGITVNSGNISIEGKDDNIHSDGYLVINGGTFTLSSNDDGLHADGLVEIKDGTFNITASEGIEATYIKINGGTVNISASDDGINASNKSSDYSVAVEINGGDITIKMGSGDTDGIDSNGNLYINGGTINVTGNSPFDYDGTAEYNGGTLIVNGEETNTITNQFAGGMNSGMNGDMNGESGMMNGGKGGPQFNR